MSACSRKLAGTTNPANSKKYKEKKVAVGLPFLFFILLRIR